MSAVPLAEAPPPNVAVMRPHTFFDVPGFVFTPTGLEIEEWVEFPQWERVGRCLLVAEKGIQWAIGDWLNFGERKYGEKYSQALEVMTGRKTQTLMNYGAVAKKIETSRRRENVDYSTHAEVAGLPEKEQERVLEKADREQSTRKQVRREVHRVQRRLGGRKSEIEILQEPEVQLWLADLHKAIIPFVDTVPLTAPFLRSMVRSFAGVIEQQSERTVKSDCEAILEFFDTAERGTDDDIFKWLLSRFYFIRDPELDDRLEYMVERKMLRLERQGGRKDGQKGDLPDIYMLGSEAVFD